jgi:hypothetical protein
MVISTFGELSGSILLVVDAPDRHRHWKHQEIGWVERGNCKPHRRVTDVWGSQYLDIDVGQVKA